MICGKRRKSQSCGAGTLPRLDNFVCNALSNQTIVSNTSVGRRQSGVSHNIRLNFTNLNDNNGNKKEISKNKKIRRIYYT